MTITKKMAFRAPLLLLALPSVASANITSTLESINALSDRAGYQVNDVILTSELQRLVQSKNAVQQGRYALMGEASDPDNDNTQEAPSDRAALTGFTPPLGGGFVPTDSVASKVDGYGMPLGYCVWDHGSSNASANRITGDITVSNNNVSFVLLSSGKDRVFNTSCANAELGTISGDDIHALVTIGEVNTGIATNEHFGKPVASQATLLGLDTTNTKAGEMRMVLDTGLAYGWLDLNADGIYRWEAVSSYFYSGDTNGAIAGGQYTTNPYSVGIGGKFSDRSLVPASELEVDGKVRIVKANQFVDTDGGAQLHIGSQEALAGTSGEIARLAIQPYGHTGGPFNFVARDVGSKAYLDLRYGGLAASNSIISVDANSNVGIGNSTPQKGLHVSKSALFDGAIGNNPLIKGVHLGISNGNDPQIQLTGDASGSRPHIDFSGSPGVDYDARIILDGPNLLTFENSNINMGNFAHDGYSKLQVHGTIASVRAGGEGGQIRLGEQAGYTNQWFVDNNNDDFRIFNSLNKNSLGGSVRFLIEPDGDVGVGTSSPKAKLDVNGNLRAVSSNWHIIRKNTNVYSTPEFDNGVVRYTFTNARSSGYATGGYTDNPLTIFSSWANDEFGGSPIHHYEAKSQGFYNHPNVGFLSKIAYGSLNLGSYHFRAKELYSTGSWKDEFYVKGGGNAYFKGRVGIGETNPNAQLQLTRNSNTEYNLRINNGGGSAKGAIISGGNHTDGNASLLRVESYDATQRFLEVSDGDVRVGNDGGNTRFCLNGKCSTSLQSTVEGFTLLNNSTFTPIAFIQGQERSISLSMSITAHTGNLVANAEFKILSGHIGNIYIESDANQYTPIELHTEYSADDKMIIMARFISDYGPADAQIKITPKNDEYVALNPINTVTGTVLIHRTVPNGKNMTATEGGASLILNGNEVLDTTGRNEKTVATSNIALGWYTIATNKGDRASARFGIRDTWSGHHQSVVFYATHHFGNSSSINVISSDKYLNWPIGSVRIKGGGTYDGALLQVYVREPGNVMEAYLLGDNFQSNGWTMVPWVPDGTDPGTVNSFAALTSVAAEVQMDKIKNGGMATTGNFLISGPGKGIEWSNDPYGGAGDTAWIRYVQDGVSEDTELQIGVANDSVDNISFYQFGEERMTIKDGRVGINNTNPVATLDVNGTVNINRMATLSTNYSAQDDYQNSPITIRERGLIGVSSSSAAYAPNLNFHWGGRVSKSLWMDTAGVLTFGEYDASGNPSTNGTIRAASFAATSDRRKKRNIHGIRSGLDTINAIEGITYQWKDEFSNDQRRQYGFIAQDLMKTLPDAVVQDHEGYYSVKYDAVTPFLVEAVKELDDKNDEQDEVIERHQNALEKLKADIRQHELRLKNIESKTSSKNKDQEKVVVEAVSVDKKTNETLADKTVAIGESRQSDAISRFYAQ